MPFEVDLRTRLKNAATTAGTRIDWDERPQTSAYPAVVLETVFDDRAQHMKGFQGYRPTRVQASCLATTKAAAVTLRNAVIAALVPEGTAGATDFRRAQSISHFGRPDTNDTGTVFNELVDLTLWHNG